jgi:hypothetical protein
MYGALSEGSKLLVKAKMPIDILWVEEPIQKLFIFKKRGIVEGCPVEYVTCLSRFDWG